MTETDAALDPCRVAAEYGGRLLADLRTAGDPVVGPMEPRHPDAEWAASGAMALTGFADGPPLLAPAPLASAMRGAMAALSAIAHAARLPGDERLRAIDTCALIGERAALSGFSRRGRISPGGSCHLLRSRDGWIAVNLARADDLSLLPAWLGEGDATDALAFVKRRVRTRSSAEIVAAARELGLPVAEAVAPAAGEQWRRVVLRSTSAPTPRAKPPLVVDLSSLWAGPLATHLLSFAGARVIKVESTQRSDGARRGATAFFNLLNAEKESVALDFTTSEGRRALAGLLEHADIVVEASRPRALTQLGVEAEAIVRKRAGLVWLSITGYGRGQPECNWVAFGDDAGVAAGLASAMNERAPNDDTRGGPLFCGDAIADPLTGIHAALAALSAWHDGGGVLLDVNLRDVTAHVLGIRHRLGVETLANVVVAARTGRTDQTSEDGGAANRTQWDVVTSAGTQRVLEPRARDVTARAAALGAHSESVLREFRITC